MRRFSNYSIWRCATSRKSGPGRCPTGKLRSTVLPSSTKTACRLNRHALKNELPGKNPGYGNRGKTNCVFPPFPQPLLLVINQYESHRPKQPTIVYTKYLTLPQLIVRVPMNFDIEWPQHLFFFVFCLTGLYEVNYCQ